MKNEYYIKGDITEIVIVRKNGDKYSTLIDTEDFDKICNCISLAVHIQNLYQRTQYVKVYRGRINKTSDELLHRVILGDIPLGMVVDHINHNGLDNRKENLRICTVSENGHNRRKQSTPKAKYLINENKWTIKISYEGKSINLGTYDTKELAESAYRTFRSMNIRTADCDKHITPIQLTPPRKHNPRNFSTCKVNNNRWHTQVYYTRKNIYIGTYDTKELATANAEKILKLLCEGVTLEALRTEGLISSRKVKKVKIKHSKVGKQYTISYIPKRNLYRADLIINKMRKHVGVYSSKEEAEAGAKFHLNLLNKWVLEGNTVAEFKHVTPLPSSDREHAFSIKAYFNKNNNNFRIMLREGGKGVFLKGSYPTKEDADAAITLILNARKESKVT